MNLQQLVILAFQVSILLTVFGFGLKATIADVLYLVERPGLLARCLVAMFVVMPCLAVALALAFDFSPTVEISLVALAISPIPPLLPKKESKAGGHASFALGLMVTAAILSIALVPAAVQLLAAFTGRHMAMAPAAIAGVVVKAIVLPLIAGIVVRRVLPGTADRLEMVATLVARVLLPLAIVALLAGAASTLWALIGDGTVIAIVLFTIAGLAVGHLLGGPNHDDSVVLALSTACRHPAIALSIAAANYPGRNFGGTILLALIVSTIVTGLYVMWQRRPTAPVFA